MTKSLRLSLPLRARLRFRLLAAVAHTSENHHWHLALHHGTCAALGIPDAHALESYRRKWRRSAHVIVLTWR